MPLIAQPRLPVSPDLMRSSVRAIVAEDLRDVAGAGGRLSRRDMSALSPFLHSVAETLRARSRTVGRVADAAADRAASAFERENQPKGTRGHEILSMAEQRRATQGNPGLTLIAERARARARQVAHKNWGYATFGDAFIDE